MSRTVEETTIQTRKMWVLEGMSCALGASTRITAPSSLILISICADDPTVSIQ